MKFKVFIYCFIVFLISQYFSSYSWNSPFLEDDFLWAGQARLISEGMPHNAIDGSFFRPFSHNYFWQIMYNLSGNDPFNYHLINGMFHGINTVFLYLITRKYSSEMIGLSASLLFAAHPSTHRAVWWISGITETSQAVGFLGVILIWINCLRRVTEDKKYSVYTTI